MLQKEFEEFNRVIKIETETHHLIEKRDKLKDDFIEKFPEKCSEEGIIIKSSEIDFVSQGSYKLNTTIKSKSEGVDLDLGVIFPLNIHENEDPRKIKKKGKSTLEITNIREPIIKEPCITVEYIQEGEDWIHIDFPLYARYKGDLYLARGKEHGKSLWEISDPHGLNDYILERLKKSSGQPRRLVRYLKKWKQEAYSSEESNNKKPPSIGLTLFAIDLYQENDSDLIAFKTICENILNQFIVSKDYRGDIIKATINKELPVQPYSDIFSKYEAHDSHGITFYKRLRKAVSNLENAIECDNSHDAANYVVNVLGEEFEVPEKEVKSYDRKHQREHSFG